ncbi:MAG: phosphoglycolate phosphatase [Gammaproteobacteria bacterium]|nr:MAG: phosphoglycolate phosphatase [Gammaproteobacteria bacterium]
MRLAGAEIRAVFFDLDGTLVDSAPDMIAAMRRLRAQRGESEIDLAAVGAVVSKGGRAMLRKGFPGADEATIDTLLPRFLDLYAEAIATHTRTFPGIDALLDALEERGVAWGIVTNKPGWLARALVAELTLAHRCAALVSGDCLPQRKPDPAPLLHACTLARVEAGHCIYVGDDARDIEAGQRAGMRTIAVSWGYLDGEDPQDWGADRVIAAPHELLATIGLA